jgi:hypothetical protein
MKVGLSLSFCVRDIIEGNVSINDVAFIYSATKAETGEQWESVIDSYKRSYWYENPDEAERIARHFINENLVIQPRLEGKILNYAGRKTGGCWIEQSEFNAFCKANLKSTGW